MKSFSFLMVLSYSMCVYAQSEKASMPLWEGSYEYVADLGKNVGGDNAIVTYVFTLKKKKCDISIEGYQTSRKIICASKAVDNKLMVYFNSFGNGKIKNEYDVEEYPVHAKLFKLEETKNDLITVWESLLPAEKMKKSGIYFVRKKTLEKK